MSNLFDSITFDNQQPAPSISNDDIVRVLRTSNPPSPAMIDTQGGVERVNKNTTQTGVVAYRDDKGQAVLTNVARDSTGVEKPIAALFRPPVTSNEGTPTQSGPTFVAGTNEMRIHLFEGLKQLTAEKDVNKARALYNSIQESITSEATRLQTEAFKFAENKFGIPILQQQLDEARQADRMDPGYAPGMGDSPITQKIINDFTQVSTAARSDAQDFLKRNLTFNTLQTLAKNAENELKRIEQLDAAALRRQENLDNATTLRNTQQDIRRQDRQEREEEEALRAYNGLSGIQLNRLNLLHGADLLGAADEKEKRIKLISLAQNNKDKNYQAAINAEGPRQLLSMALQGNGHARKLVILEEAQNTGTSVELVEEKLKSLTMRLADKTLVTEVLARKKNLPKEERESINATLKAAQFGLSDPSKIQKADEIRVSALLEDMQFKINNNFINDVDSWGLIDPAIKIATDKAKKTTGRADIRNVAAAYIGDAANATERVQRVQDFKKALQNAALKQKDSIFGMPNWREAEKLVIQESVLQGWFTRGFNAVRDDQGRQFTDESMKQISVGEDFAAFPHPAAQALVNVSGMMIDSMFGKPKKDGE